MASRFNYRFLTAQLPVINVIDGSMEHATRIHIQRFLLKEVEKGGLHHLMFGTDHQIQLLKQARSWYIDGTFKAMCHGLEYETNVEEIVSDYELDLWKGIRHVFPDVPIQGYCSIRDMLSGVVSRQSINDESFEILDSHGATLTIRYSNRESKTDNSPEDTGKISPISKRTEPLKLGEFQKFIDNDGRLVDESLFRKAVFLGGVEPTARRDVWQFLFSLYPYSSTKREREVMLLDYIVKYNEMKNRWKTLLVLSANAGADKFEQGILARYQLDEQQCGLRSPDFPAEPPTAGFVNSDINIKANQTFTLEPDFTALSKNCQFLDISSADTQQRIEFMKIQAQVYVQRHKINITEMKNYLRIVDKDVPRTDRDIPYFRDPNIHHLTMLRDILITYATFHPDIGYVQGMNDILARFLYVFDSEVEAYWCFQNYLEKIECEFLEEGMLKKIDLVKKLLLEMDEELYQHLVDHDLGDLLFCHRWLLLGFKREFSFMDSLRVFEILSSHHLELSSLSAETARHKLQMKEFAENAGITRATPVDANSEFTLELFMCVALLQEMRMSLFQCSDACMVFDCINNLEINLDSILEKCEHLFFRYCKKTVEDSFQMIEKPLSKHR